MSEVHPVTPAELRVIVADPAELMKGTQIFDKGGLSHLARHGGKLFAEAAGSGSAPYKPQIVFDEKGIRGRCSCMAARSRPFCKHAVALLVAWSRDANGFAIAEAPAPSEATVDGGARKATRPKTGKVDANALMRSGAAQVLTLVRELASTGVSAIAAERAAQVRALAETLRAERLRRLSARTLELASLLEAAARDYGSFDPEPYAEALGDLLLSARRIEKHLDGDQLKPEYVEELIGRNWTKKDREPLASLDLVQYSFRHNMTADDFVIRESRFVDLNSGEHFSEKQILPSFLAKRTPPKASYGGLVLAGASGSRYPGFAPVRLEVGDCGKIDELDQATLERLLQHVTPGVAAALAALQERRRDPFAPDAIPVALACSTLLAEAGRLFAIDKDGSALALPKDPETELLLTSALAEAGLVAVFGEVALDGALPTLFPFAVLLRQRGAMQLVQVGAGDSSEWLLKQRSKASSRGVRERWLVAARELGVGAGALILGELREELAETFAEGLGALDRRRVQPWVARLQELGLAKPAVLMEEVASRADPVDKLDDAVKLHQVFSIGLARLASARTVELGTLAPSPLHPAIHVSAPAQHWSPAELPAMLHGGRLGRHERAIVIARSLAEFTEEDLARLADVLWADGSVTALLADAYARFPRLALQIARMALTTQSRSRSYSVEAQWAVGARVSKLTALKVLSRLDEPEARALLQSCVDPKALDPALRATARNILGASVVSLAPSQIEPLHAANREERIAALQRLGRDGAIAALPLVRQLGATDPSREVRYAAWAVQALLLDLDAVDQMIERVRARASDDEAAREAAFALGLLGDARSIPPLLDAFEQAWRPATVAESLCALGPAVLPALLDRVDRSPDLAARSAAQQVVTTNPAETAFEIIKARFDGPLEAADVERMARYIKLASGLKPLKARLADELEAQIVSIDPKHKVHKAASAVIKRARAQKSSKPSLA
jgi:hypothetical protein